MKQFVRVGLILFLSILGVADAIYLTLLKLRDEVMGSADSAICSAVSETGCSIALESSMASILGIPVSLLAVVTYLFVFGFGIALWRSLARSHPADATPSFAGASFAGAALLLVAAGAVLYSLVLAVYSYQQGAWCPFCVGLYVINLGLLAVTASLYPSAWRHPSGLVKTIFKSPKPLVSILLVFVLALGASQLLFDRWVESSSGERLVKDRERVQQALAFGRLPIAIDGAPTKGPEDAPITLVKFSDFQCPHCRRFWTQVDEFMESHPRRIRMVFRHNPLSEVCNPTGPPMHERACHAAYAAVCAQEQGHFFEMADLLFEHQDALSDADLLSYADTVGLDTDRFKVCMAEPETVARVRSDALTASSLGIMGTPYSVINDYLFPGGMSVASIQSITKGLLEELDDREELGSLNADYEKLQSILDQGVVSLPPAEWVLVPTPVPLEQRITLFVDPVNPMVREHLSWLRRLQMMRMGAIQVDFRFLSPVGCSGDSESVDEGCRMARLLACSFSTAKGEELLQRLDQPGTTDTEVLQRQVTTDVPEIGACLATGTPGEILDADGAIAARLNVHMGEPVLFANGYRIDGPTNPKELIQILSGALLRAHASAQP